MQNTLYCQHMNPFLTALIVCAIIGFVIIGAWHFYTNAVADDNPRGQVVIGQHTFKVEFAETLASQEQGLSDRNAMAQDEGMLFIFSAPKISTFWMKGMQFPLDVLWIEDGVIVDISRNIPPPSQTGGVPRTMSPTTPADMVLEINAGFVDQLHINTGDTIHIYRN